MEISKIVNPYDKDPEPVNEDRPRKVLAIKAPPKKTVRKQANLSILAEIAAIQPKIAPVDLIKVNNPKPKYMGYAHYQLVKSKLVAPIPLYRLELRKIN